MRRPLSQEELLQLFKLDEEVIDIETSDTGNVFPVVRAYDDERVHFHFWCVHCREWHVHGRGGPDEPYKEGSGGLAGHRLAHCTTSNSPYGQKGVILHVTGKFSDAVRKRHRRGTNLYCPRCGSQYSAALNGCSCGFINKSRKPSHPKMAERYKQILKN